MLFPLFSLEKLRFRGNKKLPKIVLASQVALVVKNLPASAGDERDMGSVPGLGRSPTGGHDNPLHYSCLENSVNREVWPATVHGIAKSQTLLSDYHFA